MTATAMEEALTMGPATIVRLVKAFAALRNDEDRERLLRFVEAVADGKAPMPFKLT